jgi:hypothetical protein
MLRTRGRRDAPRSGAVTVHLYSSPCSTRRLHMACSCPCRRRDICRRGRFDPETMFRVIQDERCTALSVPLRISRSHHPARQNTICPRSTGTCARGLQRGGPAGRAAAFPMPELVQSTARRSSTLIAMADHSDADRVSDAGLRWRLRAPQHRSGERDVCHQVRSPHRGARVHDHARYHETRRNAKP